MRLIHAWIPKECPITFDYKATKNKTARSEKRYQVRWSLDIGEGIIPNERRKSNFATKARAQAFIDHLWLAHYGKDGWHFTTNGDPTDTPVASANIIGTLTKYAEIQWKSNWQEAQRAKVRGQLLQLIAITVQRPSDRAKLLAGLEYFRKDRGNRPEPKDRIEWAALWLRDYIFYPGQAKLPQDMVDAKSWLESQSLPISVLTDSDEVERIKAHFVEGQKYATARTYWTSTVVPYFEWLYDTRKLEHSPLRGVKKLKRDLEAERPDPSRIPSPRQLWSIASAMGVAHGDQWETFTLVAGHCALRLSEALAIRLNSFVWRDENLWLSVNAQEHRVIAACNDEGSTKVRTKTKSTRDRTPPPRLVPIPLKLRNRLVDIYGAELTKSDTYLFCGPRGAVANADTVRSWWHIAVATALPNDTLLSGVKPHVMRHAGMTYWFAAGNDHKRIQQWGGWTSLTQMLDTYRGVLDSLEGVELDGLDEFFEQFEEPEDAIDAEIEIALTQGDNVVNLDDYRRRRA